MPEIGILFIYFRFAFFVFQYLFYVENCGVFLLFCCYFWLEKEEVEKCYPVFDLYFMPNTFYCQKLIISFSFFLLMWQFSFVFSAFCLLLFKSKSNKMLSFLFQMRIRSKFSKEIIVIDMRNSFLFLNRRTKNDEKKPHLRTVHKDAHTHTLMLIKIQPSLNRVFYNSADVFLSHRLNSSKNSSHRKPKKEHTHAHTKHEKQQSSTTK